VKEQGCDYWWASMFPNSPNIAEMWRLMWGDNCSSFLLL